MPSSGSAACSRADVRIWDVAPGYLNRQSLLGEHRELHGLANILIYGKRGYARHPETLRWLGCLSGLARRHAQLVAEMRLRGYTHLSPLDRQTGRLRWPDTFVTPVHDQYALLGEKYRAREPGRIPLPRNAQALWAQHKYSVMARDVSAYQSIGRAVARMRRGAAVPAIAEDLALFLRTTPSPGGLTNALEHMWGHISKQASDEERRAARRSAGGMLSVTCALAMRLQVDYLVQSTALGELSVFVSGR